jgi:hypothetical protein
VPVFSLGIKLAAPKSPRQVPPDEERCVRHIPSKGGERCKRWRQKGATECATHNNTPQKQSTMQRKQAAYAAKERAVRKYEKEGPLEISGAEDVINLLEERMGVQIQMARALDELVGRLTAAGEMRYEHRAGEQLRGEVQVWLQLNQQLTKLGADYLKIGLDERKVQIAEAQAKILVGVIRAILDRLDLSGEQRRIAARAVPEELERVAIEGRK